MPVVLSHSAVYAGGLFTRTSTPGPYKHSKWQILTNTPRTSMCLYNVTVLSSHNDDSVSRSIVKMRSLFTLRNQLLA